MAQLVFEVPDAVAARAVNAVAYYNGYMDTIIDPATGNPIPNPETKAHYAKMVIARWIKAQVVAYERRTAAGSAGDQSEQAAESEITVTPV